VEPSIFDDQCHFLKNLMANSPVSKFGLPSDYYPNVTEDTMVVSAQNMFAAAMTTDDELRSILIARLNDRANLNNTSGVPVGAFPLLYDSNNGSAVEGQTLGGGIANPAQGALFAILALNAINISSSTSPPSTGTSPPPTGTSPPSTGTSPPSTGTVVPTATSQSKKGVSVGTIISVVTACVTGALVLLQRRRRRDKVEDVGPSYMVVTPFLLTNHEATGTQEDDALVGVVRQYTPSTDSEIAQTLSEGDRLLPSPFPERLSSPMGAASGNVKGPPPRRANTLPSEGAHAHAESNEPQRGRTATPTVLSEPLEDVASVPSDVHGLRLAVEALQREMERLRAERFEAPPSYTADAP